MVVRLHGFAQIRAEAAARLRVWSWMNLRTAPRIQGVRPSDRPRQVQSCDQDVHVTRVGEVVRVENRPRSGVGTAQLYRPPAAGSHQRDEERVSLVGGRQQRRAERNVDEHDLEVRAVRRDVTPEQTEHLAVAFAAGGTGLAAR